MRGWDEKTKWGEEFCRVKYCAVMSESRQDHCCSAFKQCCAYVEMRSSAGPFTYLEVGEVAKTPPPPPPPPTFNPRDIYVGPPKSMRLVEETKPPSLSLTRHHHHHHYRNHHSTPQPRPAIHLLGAGEDIMKTSYNDQLVKDHERLCVASFCALMSPNQHKLCCSIYDQCCSYSNYRHLFDPFHPDNNGRRR
ncbi:hypothetical protein O3P69_006105 [Scylla paramamosain]|uniref:Uncharacterized protein n=1 Tax=Scylla paramamosain TaxID=85552 RepID=A0AAW0U5W1_SCYPA